MKTFDIDLDKLEQEVEFYRFTDETDTEVQPVEVYSLETHDLEALDRLLATIPRLCAEVRRLRKAAQ